MSEITQPTGTDTVTPLLDDDQTITRVRNTRLAILDTLTANGQIPTDSDGFEMLHKNLQELDKSAYQGKRLKQDEKSTEALAQIARITADRLATTLKGANMFTGGTPIGATTDALAEIEGTATIAPNELFDGNDTRSFEEFNATVGRDLDAKRRGTADTDEENESA